MTLHSLDSPLYQLIQKINPALTSISVSSSTLKGVIHSLFDFLIQQQISPTVWVKLPNNSSWLVEVERYLQEGTADRLYLCSSSKELSYSFSSPQLTPIELEASSHLRKECFVIVYSPQFYCLILAHQIDKKQNDKAINWRLVYTFNLEAIESFIKEIKQEITINDSTPEEILTTKVAMINGKEMNFRVVENLLLKQIEYTESLNKKINIQESAGETIENLTNSLNFKNDILTNLSQELKLPLTNIKTALRLLESLQSKREQRQRYIQLLQRECDRQNSVIVGLEEFLQFDRSLSSSVNPHPKLEDLIPGIVSTYQPLAEEKNIVLGYTIPAGFPPVSCPETWLRQMLQNLLNNSLKYTPRQGRINVQATLKQDKVELTISDTGIGIEPSELPKISQSFYKGRNPINGMNEGAGLGLTIVQNLITRCNGTMTINSKRGKGTTVILLLPVVNTDNGEP
ncbi:MAG: Adaptive-response sensory-kinase SasA [Chroococcopsis gigantea SAG 12.99]|jgi:two-component system phosphate regulon sensor histidine kinase PhoR|nr:Adaptive-response sensory-kinase SasA [Chroococcopsis gigantea SAG 12.99]